MDTRMSRVDGGREALLETARLLATFQGRTGYHGSGRHISTDFDLCGGYDGSDGTAPRPCSPRCAAVQSALEQAADELGCTVEDFRGWPKRSVRAALRLEVTA